MPRFHPDSPGFAQIVLDSMAAHVAVLDATGALIAVNEAWRCFARMNSGPKLSERTAIGTNYLGVCEESARRGCEAARDAAAGIRAVIDGSRKRFELEYPCHSEDESRWFQMCVTSLATGEGGAVVSHTDITERKRIEQDLKRAEAALRNERALLRTLIDATPDLILTKNGEGRMSLCNRAFLNFTGHADEADLVGKTDFDLFPPEHAAAYREDDLQVIRSSESILDREEIARDSAGRETWRSVIKAPLRDGDGQVAGLVVISRNIQGRRERDRALQDRERLLGIVTGSIRVGLVVVGEHYEYRFANEAYGQIFGLAPAAIVGRRVPDLIPHGWPQIQPQLDRALTGERSEYEVSFPDGRWFRVMLEPRLADDFGERTVVVVVSEITHQKQADASVRESEERYRRLVDVLPAAILIHSESRIVFCNSELVRLLGAENESELLGRSAFDIVHTDFHQLARERIEAMNRTDGSMPGVEIRVVRLDGRTVPVYSVTTPLQYRGRTSYLVAYSDLTERERASELLRSVLGSVNDAILTIDERGIVQSANHATQMLFGYETSELIGGNIRVLMPEPSRGEHDHYIENYLRTGVAHVIGIGREVEALRKDGSRFPIELRISEFPLEGRRHFTGVIRDITARRNLEAQFHQAQKMEAIGRLAGGVAHDFNNLLTVINGYSDILLPSFPTGDSRREAVAAILEAGERAARLTQQLLAFSRKAIVERKLVDLNELVSETVRLLRRIIEENISITVMPEGNLGRIKADPGQLEQVVMNLVVNARDAMPRGGRLSVETRGIRLGPGDLASCPELPPGDYARLTVADTGHGMDESTRSKIFEPFFTTKGAGKGTGLGLAVVHGVVKQSGGHISVESTIGIGTTFTLFFPVVESRDSRVHTELARVASRGTETVLLVEDEDAVRRIARIGLESQGFVVIAAANGPEAIQIATNRTEPLHILVTDVIMPEMGGRELAETIRTIKPGIRVLYMSGYTDDAVLQHGVEAATDAFIQKPFTPLGLARKVRARLDEKF